jgi:hypothetical protein
MAEICKAEANVGGIGVLVGLSFDTGVSIGPEGAGVSIGGFGVSIRPKINIQTPLGGVECSIM